ncbi:DUF3987 domain-containing protein [Pseudonocardia xishanensis]|uniref:DUF3987 domain-containing protein n=1 Tax=Pseudonocardia xishanensis TaxID=630995 RepID=A0ABP8RUX7_9PSEU
MTQRRSAHDILAGLDTDHRLAVLHGDDAPQPQGWDADPIPLTPRRLVPPFPVDALPPWVADMVLAVAEFTQTPLDLPGCLALAALSTAAGGRAEIEVRPGWREPLNLYTVVAMPPGSRKSAVFAAMTSPLLEAERQLIDAARPRLIEADVARKMAGKEAERRAADGANLRDPAARAEALAAATDAALLAERPVAALPRLIADDVTTEAAASLLAEQNGRLAVLSAEGGIFSTLAGRYSSGVPSLEVFLKGHSGDLLRVDRKAGAAMCSAAPVERGRPPRGRSWFPRSPRTACTFPSRLPSPPRLAVLTPAGGDVAAGILWAVTAPERVNVGDVLYMPLNQRDW